MIDIVERLRELAECERPFIRGFMAEAADEIERLREWCRKLIEGGTFPGEGDDLRDEIERLRAALKRKAGADPNLVYPGKDADFVFPEE